MHFGGQEYCQMVQEMGCKKNDFDHLKRVKDSTKANSGEKAQPASPYFQLSKHGSSLFHYRSQGKMPPSQVCSAGDSHY